MYNLISTEEDNINIMKRRIINNLKPARRSIYSRAPHRLTKPLNKLQLSNYKNKDFVDYSAENYAVDSIKRSLLLLFEARFMCAVCLL